MASIVPTVTTDDPAEFARLGQQAHRLSKRISVDVSDGQFAPQRLIGLNRGNWPEGANVDLHLMVNRPGDHYESIISRSPSLAIVHVESEPAPQRGHLQLCFELRQYGVKTGIALLQDTPLEAAKHYAEVVDHLLLFTGKLGYYGGSFDESNFDRIQDARARFPSLEISVDGGVNADNAARIAAAGADVLYVGSAVQQANDPQSAYDKLVQMTMAQV